MEEIQIPYYTKSTKPFEEYLQFQFMDREPQVLDDDLPDAFDSWLSSLQADDFIDYGKKFAKLLLTTKNP